MSIDCEQMDGLMMDFLYQELSADGLTTFQKHMDGCARCTQELARFQGVRSAVRDLGEAEPPAGVAARLIAEAAKQVAPSPASRAWAWLVALFAPMRAHPALASVAALALVIGVGGFLARRGFEGKKPEGSRAAIDDRMESAGAAAPAMSPSPSAALQAAPAEAEGAMPADPSTGVAGNLDNGDAIRGQQGAEDQGSFEFRKTIENNQKEAEAQRRLETTDKLMADGDKDLADKTLAEADAERVARLRSAPVVVSGESSRSGAGGASKPSDLAASGKDSKSDQADGRFATPPPTRPATEPKAANASPMPSPSPVAAAPKPAKAPPTDDANTFADDEMAPPPGMVAPSGGMPAAPPDMTAGRSGSNTSVAVPGVSTGSIAAGGPSPRQPTPPNKGKVTVTSKPSGSPAVSNPMNLRDPKPMTPSQMAASADVKRRRGDCVGALPMYDEILRKYPSYLGKAAVTAGRETCLNELEGKLARSKKGGSSSAGSKAKAAPMPAREADMASDPSK